MKISCNWLQSYFEKKLPSADVLVDKITFHLCEIEGIESLDKLGATSDIVLDIKVLPDRAHYLLSHRGVAGEISAILSQPIKEMLDEKTFPKSSKTRELKIKIEEPKLCRRYIGRVVENVEVKKSSGWLKELLFNIGQRDINTVVDSANFVMFDLGQPLHAFDADKVKGGINVRLAKVGEKITTLDGKDVILDKETLIIADDAGPLAIAGIKGGNRAEVNENTKNIILESANFDPVSIRKTAQRLGIQTDASKRFENEITPELAEKAMNEFSVFLDKFTKNSKTIFGELVDVYPVKAEKTEISISGEFVSSILGVEISEKDMENILARLNIKYDKKKADFVLHIPPERLDLVIKEDIVEEIGRLYGYDKIGAKNLKTADKKPIINKNFYYSETIKDILMKNGFSEIFTSSFANKGELEILKPLAEDKKFLRTGLVKNLSDSLELNVHNSPFLTLDEVKIFEIGSIFSKMGEKLVLGIAVKNVKKDKKKEDDKVAEIVNLLVKELKTDVLNYAEFEKGKGICEIDLGEVIKKLPEPMSYDDIFVPDVKNSVKYSPISIYPFMLRDIAVFVPESVEADGVIKIIKKEGTELLVKTKLFDVFKKSFPDGNAKISYAYNLVFQSRERTLSDEEVNKIMQKITDTLNSQKGWQVR